MKGFKNSTRTQYYKGGEAKGYNTGGAAYGPPANPTPPPPPPTDNRHRLVSLGDAPASTSSSGGASVSVGRVGRGVTGIVPGSKTAGKGYGGTARVPFAKGGEAKGAAKISKVMGEFKRGELHSGSKKGPEVTSKKQATAIALSEARKAGAKIPLKKGDGGAVARGNRMQALEAREEAKLMREKDPRSAVRPSETARPSKAVPVASREPKIRNPLMDRLTQLPSQRGEFPIRKAGGGLAVMPKGKKC